MKMSSKFKRVLSSLVVLGISISSLGLLSLTNAQEEQQLQKYLSEVIINTSAGNKYSNIYTNNPDYINLAGKLADCETEFNSESEALTINNVAELEAFANAVNSGTDFYGKYVKLKNNIELDLNGTAPTLAKGTPDSDGKFATTAEGTASNVWTPMGNSEHPFKGTFDGGNSKIKNMVVFEESNSGSAYAGFFGRIDGATIKNLGITDAVVVAVSNDSYAGTLVGCSNKNSHIDNCYACGDVCICASGSVYAGGLAGKYGDVNSSNKDKNIISNSYGTGNIYAFSSASTADNKVHAGGLVGENNSGNITSSCATGNVYSSAGTNVCAGGLVGKGNGSSSITSDSCAAGDASAYSTKEACAGGLFGSSNCSISNSYAAGSALASCNNNSKAKSGGLCGEYNENQGEITDSDCYRNKDATIEGTECEKGTPLTLEQMTGGGAKNNMSGFSEGNWNFFENTDFQAEDYANGPFTKELYFPCPKGVSIPNGYQPKFSIIKDGLGKFIDVKIENGTESNVGVLTAKVTLLDIAMDTENLDFNYQWFVGDSPIEGATQSTYIIQEGDTGQGISVRVTCDKYMGEVNAKYLDESVKVPNNPPQVNEEPSANPNNGTTESQDLSGNEVFMNSSQIENLDSLRYLGEAANIIKTSDDSHKTQLLACSFLIPSWFSIIKQWKKQKF